MMATSHAVSGLAAGVATAPALGLTSLHEIALFALITAGFAVFPDLDHPSSTVTKSLGPVSEFVSSVLRGFSSLLYRFTKGPRDENHSGQHRHASHTVLFALFTGGLIAWGGTRNPWVIAGVVVFAVFVTGLAIGEWTWAIAGLPMLAWLADLGFAFDHVPAALGEMSWTVGVAAALGCVVHCVGDALTLSGCPFLFPLPIAGETWYEIRPPRLLRFRTGGPMETVVLWSLVVLTVWLLWPHVKLLFNGGVAA